jgi:hypothetical protein
MIILAIIIGTILAVIAYLLFVPIFVETAIPIGGDGKSHTVIILFPFKFRLKSKSKKEKLKPDKEALAKKRLKKKQRPKSKISFFDLFPDEYPTIKRVIIEAVRLVKGIVKAPDSYYLQINLAGGLSEPDHTGYLYGVICSIKPLLSEAVKLDFRPDFQSESLTGEVKGRVIVRIGSVVKELLLFLWRLPKLKIIKIYLKTRKGGKNGRQTDRSGIIHYERA